MDTQRFGASSIPIVFWFVMPKRTANGRTSSVASLGLRVPLAGEARASYQLAGSLITHGHGTYRDPSVNQRLLVTSFKEKRLARLEEVEDIPLGELRDLSTPGIQSCAAIEEKTSVNVSLLISSGYQRILT